MSPDQIKGPDELKKGQNTVSMNPITNKVLVVDDSNTIRKSAAVFLRQGGHDVVLAEDGFDALAKLTSSQPDIVFCDISMPRLDGYQTCAIIKSNEKYAKLRLAHVLRKSTKIMLFRSALIITLASPIPRLNC